MNPLFTEILTQSHRIAVVGLSPKLERPSHAVASYMAAQGYEIIPVNPGHREILGRKSYPNLQAIPGKIDVVNIFRRSEFVLPIVQDALTVGARYIWMQEGVYNPEAAQLAESHGVPVVMDFCMKVAHSLLRLQGEI